MVGLGWSIALLLVMGTLAFQRASLVIWTISLALYFILATVLVGATVTVIIGWLLFLLIFTPLNIPSVRKKYLSGPLFKFYRKVMPTMSRTEREAIAAGTVAWEGDLFRGNPDWKKLLGFKAPTLSAEEQAFMDGPVEKLCQMINDWDITHTRMDLSPEMWAFVKEQGFFGLIIPKQYGGKQFSAYAHSQILVKISGKSLTVSSTVAVPNSLGPAELLLHYGTEEQKNYYLPRLARGEEIPCFALTSPIAGSDAGAMTDHGIVCYQEVKGEKTLGIRLTFDKRYITLAPIATVIGLAFKLYDPDHLIGKKTDIGITCALIPRNTPGIAIGRRHFPLDTPFQNGPIHGKDVFIPIDWIIGGQAQAGKGWHMLMECLAAGRAITLPSSATGGAKILSYASGAYARIRRQFNVYIGKFEGIEEPLARVGAYTYLMDAARSFAASIVDTGEKPAVASAIVKYHVTELGRKASIDGMDIHGGKGICLGPKNYLGRGFEASPIAITVEGANILTRNMIIFGQGAMRCHPYVLKELEAAHLPDEKAALDAFDNVVMKHIAFAFSNIVRSFVLGVTSSLIVITPRTKTRRYFQHMTRFCSALALATDVCMLVLGGGLKRKENVSARLGDVLSYLYLLSAVLKHYQDQGEQKEDLPLVKYAAEFCLSEIQSRFSDLLSNFSNRPVAMMLSALIFPLGKHFKKPSDRLHHKIAQLMMSPTATRDRLAQGAYLTAQSGNVMAEIQDAFLKTIAAEEVEKTVRMAVHDGIISGYTPQEHAEAALAKNLITQEQFKLLTEADEARRKVIAVDDFSNDELARQIKEMYQDTYAGSTEASKI